MELIADSSSSRVKSLVDVAEILSIHMGIDLGRGKVRMSEHLLNCAKVSAPLQQVSGEGMPERVRGHAFADTGAASQLLEDPPGAHPGERSSPSVEQYTPFRGAAIERCPGVVEINGERTDELSPDRNQPLVATLA